MSLLLDMVVFLAREAATPETKIFLRLRCLGQKNARFREKKTPGDVICTHLRIDFDYEWKTVIVARLGH